VLHEGDRVRITAHLLQAATGQQVWAEQYEGSVRDVLESQAAVSRQIAAQLRVKFTPADQARRPDPGKVIPAAYTEYLKGRYHWNLRTAEGFRKALEYFHAATEADPNWSPPYVGLADAYLLLGSVSYDVMPPREAMPKAKAAVEMALKLDDSNAGAHTSRAYYLLNYEWNMAASEKEFRRAIELNPGYPTAHHWYGHYLMAMGKMDGALAEMRKAQERDPLSLAINTGVGWALYQARRYDEAIAQYRTTLEMEPNFVLAHCMLGMAYEETRRYAEAIAEFQRALTIVPDYPLALCRLGQTYAASGNRKEATRIIDQLARLSQRKYIPSAYPSAIYAALGDYDQAFPLAEKAYEERSDVLIYLNV
jgi:tetratricopeptide (TPR) repeat protein